MAQDILSKLRVMYIDRTPGFCHHSPYLYICISSASKERNVFENAWRKITTLADGVTDFGTVRRKGEHAHRNQRSDP